MKEKSIYNDPLKSIVVRRLPEQHVIKKLRQERKKPFSFE